MNKYITIMACIASSLVIASCTNSDKEELQDKETGRKEFLINSPSMTTRATISSLSNNSPEFIWQTTDVVSIWAKGTAEPRSYNYQKPGNRGYAAFIAQNTAVPENADKYFVMYPEQHSARLSSEVDDGITKDVITANIPTYQKATDGTFDPKAAICTGATKNKTDQSITLDHACAFLNITIGENTQCKSVKITPKNNSGWYLSGKVKIATSSAGSPILQKWDADTKNEVYLNATGTSDSGENYFGPGSYLIAIISTTGLPGIRVEVEFSDGTKKIAESDEEFGFDSGVIYDLGTVTK